MGKMKAFMPTKFAQRFATSPYESLPTHEPLRMRERHVNEKFATSDRETDDDEYEEDDDSSISSSPSTNTSRATSGSHASSAPMLRSKTISLPRRSVSSYPAPHRIVRCLCFAMIAAVLLFIFSLVHMSKASSKKVELGDVGERPPPPPPAWESFPFLSRYYGGIRNLVPFASNVPEYPRDADEDDLPLTATETSAIDERDVPSSKTFNAYPDYNSTEYLQQYMPVEECFLDSQSSVRIPKLQYYDGRPAGFPDHVIGAYDVLGLPENICFERYGRLGPYGHGYSLRHGGFGTGIHGEQEGAAAVWKSIPEVDYRKVDWAAAQKRCVAANAARFRGAPAAKSLVSQDVHYAVARTPDNLFAINASEIDVRAAESLATKKLLPRTAIVVRTWDEFIYREEDIMYLRSLIAELALGSGGEYDVHLLVQVKNDRIPVWADEETYQKHLRETVPEEFWGIATLWSETQMLMLYQGLHDQFARGPGLPVHGVYRGLLMALQWFAHKHPEYEYFWHWEMDIRYTGHFYHLLDRFTSWSREQPRKLLWERSSRFYVPSVHGSWEDFSHMVRVQTEMGAESSNNIWSGVTKGPDSTVEVVRADKPIWGPERPNEEDDWFEIENDPVPPTSYDKDKYVWGVGEEADLIALNPFFDPEGTTWGLAHDVTGYNTTQSLPPRRSAIVTASRLSRRLLTTMHRETAFKKHHAFPEMWPAMTALNHGYKAVYVPHPLYVDRAWPTPYLASVLNAGQNGATGGARTSVFGEREHNLRGVTWYYNAAFSPNLWRRWLGFRVNNDGGEQFELEANPNIDLNSTNPVNRMQGGEGRMCLPPMLLHPVKGVDLPVESINEEQVIEVGDPIA